MKTVKSMEQEPLNVLGDTLAKAISERDAYKRRCDALRAIVEAHIDIADRYEASYMTTNDDRHAMHCIAEGLRADLRAALAETEPTNIVGPTGEPHEEVRS